MPDDRERSTALVVVQLLGVVIALTAAVFSHTWISYEPESSLKYCLIGVLLLVLLLTIVTALFNEGGWMVLVASWRKALRAIMGWSEPQLKSWNKKIGFDQLIAIYVVIDLLAIGVLLWQSNGVRHSVYGPFLFTVVTVTIALRDRLKRVAFYTAGAFVIAATSLFRQNVFAMPSSPWANVLYLIIIAVSAALPVGAYSAHLAFSSNAPTGSRHGTD